MAIIMVPWTFREIRKLAEAIVYTGDAPRVRRVLSELEDGKLSLTEAAQTIREGITGSERRKPTVILETDRLIIRPFRETDIDEYASIVADPGVMRHLTGRPESYEEAARYVRDCIASERDRGYSRYAVLLKEMLELIGFCGFKEINNEIDFGWRYARGRWGQGLGTEAARVVLKYGLETLELPTVVSVSLPENVASIRIMQKLGMTPDGYGDWDGKQTIRYIAQRRY